MNTMPVTGKFGPLALALGTLAAALACTPPKVSSDGDQGGSTDPGRSPGGNGSGGGGSSGGGNSNGGGNKPGISLPDAAPPPPAMTNADANCGFKNFNLERRPAEMMLILDRSGSMREPPNGGFFMIGTPSKWDEVVPAVRETIMKTASTVQWGIKLFPGELVSCNVTAGVEVPCAIDNFQKIDAVIMGTTPTGTGTPTRYVVNKAVEYFQTTASINPRYLVLATDGEPNCADGMTNALVDADGSVEAVRAANMAGYKTFVIGIATQLGDANATLDRLADAGGTARMAMPRYYPVANKQELIATLTNITGQVASCVFPLEQQPPSPNDVAVDVDGMRLGRDQTKMSGWDYGAGNKTIEIFGASCEAIKKGMSQVKIIFGCPGVQIP